MRYFFRVEYNGAEFAGWQRQPDASTVQGEIERAFSTCLRAPHLIVGAGRTDAGVHARSQGAHIDLAEPVDIFRIVQAVNGLLPFTISIYNMIPVADDFHARFSALSRSYCYRFVTRKTPLTRGFAWFVPGVIDWNKMIDAVACLKGEHDFSSFCTKGSDIEHARCIIFNAALVLDKEEASFTIEANRFVYNMVRTLVGTLVSIGRGTITLSLEEILARKDRSLAGSTAPANALVLENVSYEGILS